MDSEQRRQATIGRISKHLQFHHIISHPYSPLILLIETSTDCSASQKTKHDDPVLLLRRWAAAVPLSHRSGAARRGGLGKSVKTLRYLPPSASVRRVYHASAELGTSGTVMPLNAAITLAPPA